MTEMNMMQIPVGKPITKPGLNRAVKGRRATVPRRTKGQKAWMSGGKPIQSVQTAPGNIEPVIAPVLTVPKAVERRVSNPYEYSYSLNPSYVIPDVLSLPKEFDLFGFEDNYDEMGVLAGETFDKVKTHVTENKWWYVGGAVVALAVAGGIGYALYRRKQKKALMPTPVAQVMSTIPGVTRP